MLSTEFDQASSPAVLRVQGEIDLATAGRLREALEQALAATPSVVVDMGDVTFIDASGLRVVLEVADALNGNGPLQLRRADLLARLLRLAGVGDVRSLELQEGCHGHG